MNVHVNSSTGRWLPAQTKAAAGICMVFSPCTTGEREKWNPITEPPPVGGRFEGIPFTVKSSAATPFTASLMSTTKSVNWVNTVLSQGGLEAITAQGFSLGVAVGFGLEVAVAVAVAVGVGVIVAVEVAVAVAVGVNVAVGVGVDVAVAVGVEVAVAVGVAVGVGVGLPAGIRNA